jgi:hypothetical protein
MAELVRVAHDAHGLNPAFDDIHREHASRSKPAWSR